jgi:CHAT domain-containing protein
LPGARREVHELGKRYAGVETHFMNSIDGAVSASDIDGPDVIHIATHLEVNDQSPWQSTIPSIKGAEGEVLRTGEIAAMELATRMAVLSSCESARGRVVSGEGVLGLSSAFLSAGVPTVVASLWSVSDLATAQFMEHFYHAIADGQTVVTALETARNIMSVSPETRHPFYWAGFVIIGDGETTIPLERRRLSLWVPLLGILLVAGATGLLIRRRRLQSRPA